MRMICIAYLATMLIPVVTLFADEKTDNEAIQGKWKVVAAYYDGKAKPDPDKPPISFEGDNLDTGLTFSLKLKGDDQPSVLTYKFRLDPKTMPRQIDLTILEDGKITPFKIPGIYILEGDTLIVCISDDVRARPTKFMPKTGWQLMIYNRVTLKEPAGLPPTVRRPNPSEPPLRLVPPDADRPILRRLEGVLDRLATPLLHEPFADNRAEIQALRHQVQELQEQHERTLLRVSELEERMNLKKKVKDEKK